MAKPTPNQIKAVRAVLYKPERVRRLRADAQSINVLMQLGKPDRGPLWTIPATGKPSSSVLEAVARCRRIAATLRATSSQLASLTLPAAHKRDLRTGVTELAASWDARADAWGEPGKPDVDAAVAKIAAHLKASARALGRVSAYLRPADSFGG